MTKMKTDPVCILGLARTPQGNMLGALSSLTAVQLGAYALQEAVKRANVPVDAISETMMGCVLSAGLGQAPARQAAILAGIPKQVGATTVNKMCGSGMKAVMLASDALLAEQADVMLAGGMESMSNAPYLLPNARGGFRYGHTTVYDHMALDGLEDAYERGIAMGIFAEKCVEKFGFTRADQDAFAIQSLTRAQKAMTDGAFADEIVPVGVKTRHDEVMITNDEQPGKANLDKIPILHPAFKKDGTITAANASSISDGASALVLARQSFAEQQGLPILARIVGYSSFAKESEWFTTAPIGAMKRLSEKVQWPLEAIDLFEINEAFAVVTMTAMKVLALPAEKVNIHGGACALGHPIGATGARLIATLVSALHRYNLRRGMASLCIGGGEATAVAIERV